MDTTYKQETNHLVVIWIALASILAGGLIGASTNAINGYVSPLYFQNILGWDFDGIWIASIAQGILEGLIYGVLFSVVLGVTFVSIAKGQVSYRFAFRHLIKIIGLVYLFWFLGGLIAMGLATLSPDFYRETFINVPDDYHQMLGYAWVGGSIWGSMVGGLLGLIFAVVNIRTSLVNKNK